MELVGYLAAVLIGISLGLIGAGGSILTVPLMIYLFRVPVLVATSYSLFIVGCTSLVGVINKNNYSARRIHMAVIFSLTSAAIVSVIRKFILPQMPHKLFDISGVAFDFSTLTTMLFAAVMILASRPLIARAKYENDQRIQSKTPVLPLLVCAIMVGIITGFLGAGGGFLIVPVLVFMLRLDMKEAITTSLLIIAINSMVGFAADLGHIFINWKLLGFTTVAAISGVFAGQAMSKTTSPEKLKVLFGWFILLVGLAILIKESIVFIEKF